MAIKPHYGGNGADLMNHTNVEIHLYDDKTGKEVPMTDRYFRDWAYYPTDPKKTIATLKKGDAMTLVPGGINHFIWESPSTTDAPGQQNITQDKKTYMYVQEFIAGNPKVGGYYYQAYSLLDPDGTSRNAVKNKVSLTPDDFKALKEIIAAPNFSTEYKDRFIISNLPDSVDSDSGIDRSVPNAVAKKKALQNPR